jgi:hypothetical protein
MKQREKDVLGVRVREHRAARADDERGKHNAPVPALPVRKVEEDLAAHDEEQAEEDERLARDLRDEATSERDEEGYDADGDHVYGRHDDRPAPNLLPVESEGRKDSGEPEVE